MNTAEGSTGVFKATRSKWDDGARNYVGRLSDKTQRLTWFRLSVSVLSIPAPVVVHSPPRIECRDSIKTLRDWRFDLPVTMATAAPSRDRSLLDFCNPNNRIVLRPRCPEVSAALLHAPTSKGRDEWHIRTQKQRGGEMRANLCLSPAARLHRYHANSGAALADPWQHSGGLESLIRCENSPAPLQLRVKHAAFLEIIKPNSIYQIREVFLAARVEREETGHDTK